jgi:signal transduction histidine kinase
MEYQQNNQAKKSITFEIIRYITLYYFSIAIIITLSHILIEYFLIKSKINDTVTELQTSFSESLTNSIWEFNDNQTIAILKGIQKSPAVLGTKVLGPKGNVLFKLGATSKLELLENKKNNNIASSFTVGKKLFEYKLPLDRRVDDKLTERLGYLYIYSGNNVILEELSHIIFYIIINSIIKTVSLWIILIIFINNKLRIPLHNFLNKITEMNPREPKPITDDISNGIIEYEQIQTSFNGLILELKNYKNILEAIVENKTELLKEKGKEVTELIAKLKRMQDNIIHQEKLSSLGLMSAGIAHELKNPLNLSMNTAHILNEIVDETNGKLNESELKDVKQYIDVIISNNVRMNSVIQNMLLQSRPDSDQKSEINLKSFIKTNLNIVLKSFDKEVSNKCSTKVDINEDLKLNVFPNEFGRLLVNVFENSLYAIQKKLSDNIETEPEIKITAKLTPKDTILLSFYDNGVGVPKEYIKKVFEPFFTTKEAGEGTGLGMYLVFEIIKRHGGNISINSEEGIFTDIQVEFPKS